MSMNPPQPPQPPAAPPPPGAQPPGAPGGEPPVPAEEVSRQKRNLIIGAVLGALALGVVGFFIGQTMEASKYDPGQDAYNEIYAKGAQSGSAVGTAKGTKQGKEEGIAEGTEQGKKSGLKEGQQQGQQEGISQGQKEGADAALGGLDGWDTDTPYIVEFGEGPNSNVPFAVQDRTLMQAGVLYKICNSGTGVCVAQQSSSSSSGGPTE